METIRTEVRAKDIPTRFLEVMAREIAIKETDEARTMVGSAVELVLSERYVTELANVSAASILAEYEAAPDIYRDRADRSRREALCKVLETRFPDVPDAIDSYDENASLTYGQHVAKHYAPYAH